jgi:two-component system sensor histidine kinase YesM
MLSPIILLGVLSVIIIQGDLVNEIQVKNVQILRQNTQAVESVLSAVDIVGSGFDTSAKNQQALKSLLNRTYSSRYTQDEYDDITYFITMLRSYQSANTYIESIYLYVNNEYGNVFSSKDSITNFQSINDSDWLSLFQEMDPDQIYLIRQRVIEEFEYESAIVPSITTLRQIQNLSFSKTKPGVVIVNFRKRMIVDLLNSQITTPGSAIFLYSPDGQLLCGTSQSEDLNEGAVATVQFSQDEVFQWNYNGKTYICFRDTSDIHGISLLSIIPRASIYKHTTDLIIITVIVLLISLLIGTAISYYIARKNDRSLSMVLATIKAADNDEPLPVIFSSPKNEFDYVLHNIISVFIKQSTHRMQLAEKKYNLRTMELINLQSQINPHFMFNTLRTIFWKTVALTGSPNEASRMIEYLSDILSFVFTTQSHKVALKMEMDYANSYLSIQRIRHDNKFSVFWRYDNELLGILVIKLILQPILENSIQHGFGSDQKESCLIRISIDRKDDFVRIRVTDNGAGMNRAQLKKVRDDLERRSGVIHHIGLSNVKNRLAAIYGKENAAFSIHSRVGIGTCVEMRFPCEKHKKED